MIKKYSIVDIFSFCTIFIAFIFFTNGELYNSKSNALYYFPYLLCLLALFFEILNSNISITKYIWWRVLIVCLVAFTMMYSVDYNLVFFAFKRVVLLTVVTILLYYKSISGFENIKIIISLIVLSIVLNLLYVYNNVDMAMLEEDVRLGVNTINESWNSNSIGLSAACAALLSLYYFKKFISTKKLITNIVFLFLMTFFGYTIILSGSRKALILFVGVMYVYYCLVKTKNMITNTLIGLVLLGLLYYLLINVDFFYDKIGYRFESYINSLTGASGADQSAILRERMIEKGVDFFLDKPILGYGFNCFSYLFGKFSGASVYSHNNFIEILVSSGIIGFVIYYTYPISILLMKFPKDNNNLKYLKIFFFFIMLLDYGMVSYYDVTLQSVLCLIIVSIGNELEAYNI